MTHSEARKRAVEAAARWLAYEMSWSDKDARYFVEGVMREAERTMAEAGWRTVRDVPLLSSDVFDDASPDSRPFRDGWNACRAAMLGDDDGR